MTVRRLSVLTLAAIALPRPAPAQQPAGAPTHAQAPEATAVAVQGSISLDGRLDEQGWAAAPAITEFTQLDPREGEPASERTVVRIVYDAEALYVGATLYDRGAVSSRLARRDVVLTDSDWLTVALDSYHDHLTAYRFAVNPAGVRRDDVFSSAGSERPSFRRQLGDEGDASWDPVWQVATAVTDSGWVAEMRIPFGQLRFTPHDEQTWGLQLERRIARTQEQALFAFTPKREPAGVARYGHLRGLRGIRSSDRLELLPYMLGHAAQRPAASSAAVDFPDPYHRGSDLGGGVGADLKYRITSNFTLNATLNPDFGQVEVDPAVINLTAFETRYDEKRPFFVEGADIFRFGPGSSGPSRRPGPAQLLYSRRIGRAPQLRLPNAAVYSDAPGSTTILGAAKLTGRTRDGWSFGLLEAVTDREVAPFVDARRLSHEVVVEPLTNYLVARVKRDFNGGRSSLGGIATSVHRRLDADPLRDELRSAAYAGGVDFRHEWANRVWSVTGYLAPSYIAGSPEAILDAQRASRRYFQRPDAEHLRVDSAATSLAGYVAAVDFGKRSGAWTGNVDLTATSPGYEVNDLGFQTAADRVALRTSVGYEQLRPGTLFRRWSVRTGPELTWNYAGDLVEGESSVFFSSQWLNYWSTAARIGRNLPGWNDRLTRGGPLAREPGGYSGFVSVNTDPRKSFTANGFVFFGQDESGASRTGLNYTLGFRPASNWLISFGPDLTRSFATAQYVTTIADPLADHTFGRRYIFADLQQTTLGVETRLNVTFTPGLTLELYAQPFLSSGDFGGPKELSAPRTLRFTQYGTDQGSVERTSDGRYTIDPDGAGPARAFRLRDRDFNYRSLRGNAVLRWEWRPGSTLFLVWQQDRSDQLTALAADPATRRVGNFNLQRDTRELFDIRPSNTLILKVSYWLNP